MAENVGNHPNSFFSSAVAYEKATKKAEAQKEQRTAAQGTKVVGENSAVTEEEPKDVAMTESIPVGADEPEWDQ